MISGPTNKRGKGRMGNRTHNANSSSIQPLSEQNPPASNFKN
ncbi:GSCOCG00012922001-RA-CDS [Cotesia congregata]|nr:GSCOCG00012922001-RA-CDS [Cotesia congregata]